jgi:hypothetical protein
MRSSKEFIPELREYLSAAENSVDDESKIFSMMEIQGRRAVHAVKTYVDGGGLDFAEIEVLDEDVRARWLEDHAVPRALEQYKALTDIVRGRDRYRAPIQTGDVQTDVTSQYEASKIVRGVCDTLGLTNALLTEKSGIVAVDIFTKPSDELVEIVRDINKHSLRVFNDRNSPRRVKKLAEGVTSRRIVGTLGVALKFIGADLEPQYKNERDREKRKNATGYALQWTRLIETYEPHPRHPSPPAQKFHHSRGEQSVDAPSECDIGGLLGDFGW